jgi:NtrC-family two-component system sensor histidine kinase KinB
VSDRVVEPARGIGLRTRLVAWGAVLVTMTALSGWFGAVTFSRVSSAMGEALRGDRDTSRVVHALTSALEDEDDAVLLSVSGDGPRARQELAVERKRFDTALEELEGQITTDADERASVHALRRYIADYRVKSDVIVALDGVAPARELYRQDAAPLLKLAAAECGKLREHEFHALQAASANARDEASRAMFVASFEALAALLALGFVAWHLARTVLRPLRDLTDSVEAVRRADFSQRVTPRADDELGRLARGFNEMAATLGEVDASRIGDVLAANQTLERTLEALPEAVLVFDADGVVTRSNARARELLGEGKTLSDFPLSPAIVAGIEETRNGSAAKNPSRADLGRAMTLTVGEEARLFMPYIVGVGKAVVLVLDEVTEFARLDEMRTEFVAAAAHELRTPLTTLRMTLALLEEAAPSLTAQQLEMLATARIGCDQLASTVDEFLDLTRIEAGPLVLAKDPIDARGLVRQVTGALRGRFTEQRIVLDVDDGSEELVFHGDRARLSAALSNLLTNALKYTPGGGNVRAFVERTNGSVRFVVDDDGPGVPTELRERVFQKYFRVEQVRAEHSDVHGAGIGLYLCRQVAEGHGGRVQCEASPWKGARFVLELPAKGVVG